MNELQKSYETTMAQIRKEYPSVISEILTNISAGQSVSDAVDNAYKDTYYLQNIEDKTVGGVMGTSQLGLGSQLTLDLGLASDYYLFTEFKKGITLKNSIWNGNNQAVVKKTIGDYLQRRGNVKDLAKEIGKVGTPNAKLPKLLEELKKNAGKIDDREVARAIRQANKLKTTPLKNAYKKLAKATINGKGLELAVSNAIKQKSNYLNERVARTEMARAYGQSFYRKVHEDKDIIAVRVSLSSGHPKPDQCDFITEQNPANWGAGVYPVSMLPSFPFHQNCLCSMTSVRINPDNPLKNGRYSQQRSMDYLDSLSEQKRKDILGVAVSKDRSKWLPTMEKKGFRMLSNQPMTAKKVIKELA